MEEAGPEDREDKRWKLTLLELPKGLGSAPGRSIASAIAKSRACADWTVEISCTMRQQRYTCNERTRLCSTKA